MTEKIKYQLIYFSVISLVSMIITIYDKIAAKIAPRHRVPEKVLLMFGAVGGALVMYIVMRVIRHKTRKRKFMAGLPVMVLVQAGLVAWVNWIAAG